MYICCCKIKSFQSINQHELSFLSSVRGKTQVFVFYWNYNHPESARTEEPARSRRKFMKNNTFNAFSMYPTDQ